MRYYFLFVCLFVFYSVKCENSFFDNDLHLEEEETGGQLRLQSRGRLSDIVDLDQETCVKVRTTVLNSYLFPNKQLS